MPCRSADCDGRSQSNGGGAGRAEQLFSISIRRPRKESLPVDLDMMTGSSRGGRGRMVNGRVFPALTAGRPPTLVRVPWEAARGRRPRHHGAHERGR
jgi:hypothetical protein